jgi:signal transduction histidine kinase
MMNMSVKAVFVDGKGRVWAGTSALVRAGLFQLYDGQFQRVASALVANRDVSALHEDATGRLWVGTQGGLVVWDETGWKAFTTRDGLSANDISAIAHDPEGSIWAGTRGGGLNRLRGGQFTVYHRSESGLPADDVSSLLVDGDGVLWIGTEGGGVARFYQDKWTRYSKKEGLISNSITYLLEDPQGFLWIGSSAGLMRVEKKALNGLAHGTNGFLPLRTYGQSDGLPIGECTRGSQPSACRTKQGTLLFPTIHGLAMVDPTQLRRNTNPPPVTIEAVLFGGEILGAAGLRTPRPQTATIPAGQEGLEIHYTSLNLSAPERARFRYRLEDHEKVWFEAGDARFARYSKLPAGQYRFRVTACNEDGVWNEAGAVLALIVQPPFYQTWWFLTAVSFACLGLIVSAVRYFSVQKLERQLAVMRQHQALEKERARIARDIHDQLGASLTQVSLLGEMVEADKDQASEVEAHARQICQTARDTTRTLDEIVWTVNPSNDTLEGLANYVCKYAQDYLGVAGVRYRLDVPPDLPPTPIPPEVRHNVFLAAKEAVTNVVRHAQASSVWIRLKLEPGQFRLEIADDGKGLAGMDEQRAATRNGLRNMRKRMEDVGGAFEMGPAPEGGLQVRLTVPLPNGR